LVEINKLITGIEKAAPDVRKAMEKVYGDLQNRRLELLQMGQEQATQRIKDGVKKEGEAELAARLEMQTKILGMLAGEDDPRIKAMAEQSELEAQMQAESLRRVEEYNRKIMEMDAIMAEAKRYGLEEAKRVYDEQAEAAKKYQDDIARINSESADWAVKEMRRQDQAQEDSYNFRMKMAKAAESMANDAIELGLVTKEEMKPILVASAIAQGAAAAVRGVQLAWNSSQNYYQAIALSAAAVGSIGMSTAVQVKKIQSAATGADFVATEPQLMLVGDNPGSQGERVSVTPLGSNNLNGPQGGGGGATININITGGQSPQATGRELAKAIKMLHVQGLL
jgi:hypothetical protein